MRWAGAVVDDPSAAMVPYQLPRKGAVMLRSNDCEAQRHAWQVATAAVVLLAGVCWAPPVGADDVPGTIGAGPIRKLVIDPHTPATL